jgi:hypothetical protein
VTKLLQHRHVVHACEIGWRAGVYGLCFLLAALRAGEVSYNCCDCADAAGSIRAHAKKWHRS